MNAGIDFGTTLVKAYWYTGRYEQYDSTANDLDRIVRKLQDAGIRRIRVTGIRSREVSLPGIEIVRAAAGAVDDEIALQASGVRRLLDRTDGSPKRMIIASVGTGVSYTKVSGAKAKRYPLGSAHGGGTIMGLARLVGADSFTELETAAARGTPADLCVKDHLPEMAGSPLGELVISHFSRPGATFEERCASVFNFAASSIAKDLAVLTSIPFSPKHIVMIGSVCRSTVFRAYLQRWSPFIKGCTLQFPEGGEYAAAIGAYHAIAA